MLGRPRLRSLGIYSPDHFALRRLALERERVRAGWFERGRDEDQTTKAARAASRPPWDTQQAYLKRETYRLARHFRDAGLLDIVVKVALERYRSDAARPSVVENPFHWMLLAIVETDLTHEKRDGISRATVRHLAAQMLYADRHDVPEELLIGFIMQVGAHSDAIYAWIAEGRHEQLFTPDG